MRVFDCFSLFLLFVCYCLVFSVCFFLYLSVFVAFSLVFLSAFFLFAACVLVVVLVGCSLRFFLFAACVFLLVIVWFADIEVVATFQSIYFFVIRRYHAMRF